MWLRHGDSLTDLSRFYQIYLEGCTICGLREGDNFKCKIATISEPHISTDALLCLAHLIFNDVAKKLIGDAKYFEIDTDSYMAQVSRRFH